MKEFLKKYRLPIIVMLVLIALSFFYIPGQEKLYLKSDFGLLKEKANRFLIWLIVISAAILLVLGLRTVKSIGQVGNVLLGILSFSVGLYFFLTTIILSVFLLLNRIKISDNVEKKYLVSFFVGDTQKTLILHDPGDHTIVISENIRGIEKIKDVHPGDMLGVFFNKGLLGFNFDPRIK
jgi:hypothetical protein